MGPSAIRYAGLDDRLTDLGIEFIRSRPRAKPFFLMLHPKAPQAVFDLGVLVLNFYTSFKIDQDTVAINLAGGAEVEQALHNALRISHGWAFTLLRNTIRRAQLHREKLWEALGRLGEELDVDDLVVARAGGPNDHAVNAAG